MTVDVGFTGTRREPTLAQHAVIVAVLEELGWRHGPGRFHYGACAGADKMASIVADSLGYELVAHPASDVDARWKAAPRGLVLPERRALERNRDIVDATDVLVACPRCPEKKRSGTWSTIRYARDVLRSPLVIVWPDGRASDAATRLIHVLRRVPPDIAITLQEGPTTLPREEIVRWTGR